MAFYGRIFNLIEREIYMVRGRGQS